MCPLLSGHSLNTGRVSPLPYMGAVSKTHQMVKNALEVAQIRRRHRSNAAFGAAMQAAGWRSLGHQDRAALVRIAELVEQHGAEQVSQWIGQSRYSSPQHVWANSLSRRLSKTRPKPAPETLRPQPAPVSKTDDEAEEQPYRPRSLLRNRTTDKLDPALVQALERLAKAVFDATPRAAYSSLDWKPHGVRQHAAKAVALLSSQPPDVIANFEKHVAFISDQTTCHMVYWAPSSTRTAAARMLFMIDEWAGRPRRKVPQPRRE